VLPQLRELEQRFANVIAVVGVHSGKYIAERDTVRIRDASIRLGATHPVLNDRQFRVWRAYAVRAWPTLVAIDPRGSVVGMSAGEFTADAVTPFIERVVAAARSDGSLREELRHFPVEAPSAAPGELAFPGKVAVDGDRIAVADSGHHRVLVGRLEQDGTRMRVERVVGSGSEGLADGSRAEFRYPQGLAFDVDVLYVADAGNHAVRAIDLASGSTRTIAGTGAQLRSARDRAAGALSSPWDLALAGDTLHVAMAGNHQLWSIDLRSGVAAHRTGSGSEALHDGSHAAAALAQTMGLALEGDLMLAADAESSAVREVDLDLSGGVRTVVGTGLFDLDRRPFFAVGDRADPVAGDPRDHHVPFDRFGAAFAEREVVFGGALFVAVAFDLDAEIAEGPHQLDVGRQRVTRLFGQGDRVELEVDAFEVALHLGHRG